jgi:hypothetical protein
VAYLDLGKIKDALFLKKNALKTKKKVPETDFPNEFCLVSGKAFCGSSHISRGYCLIVEYKEELEKDNQYFDNSKYGGVFSSANYCPVSSAFDMANGFEKDFYNPDNCKNGYERFSIYGEKIGDNSLCFETLYFQYILHQMLCQTKIEVFVII